ncbi:MAG TPA: isochorismatase family protein [Candidatus Limnocylindrales bacterium]
MIDYDPTTALIVVDVQNDFADPAGSLFVNGGPEVAERCAAEAWRASQAGAFVVCTQDWHPGSTPHFAKDGGIWPVHCVAGTWGAELHPALPVLGPIVRKGANGEDGYSGFTMRDPVSGETIPTELEGLLRGRDIERVVICGLATDYCVNATAIDARRLGFATEVLEDAIAAVDLKPGDGAAARAAMAEAGCTFRGPTRRPASRTGTVGGASGVAEKTPAG